MGTGEWRCRWSCAWLMVIQNAACKAGPRPCPPPSPTAPDQEHQPTRLLTKRPFPCPHSLVHKSLAAKRRTFFHAVRISTVPRALKSSSFSNTECPLICSLFEPLYACFLGQGNGDRGMAVSLVMRLVDGDPKRRLQGRATTVSTTKPNCARSGTPANASTKETTIPLSPFPCPQKPRRETPNVFSRRPDFHRSEGAKVV